MGVSKTLWFVPILLIFICGVAGAVTITDDVKVNLTDINLTIDNLTFDRIVISSDSIRLDDGSEGVTITMSSTVPANVTLYEAGKDRIIASSDNHNTVMQFYVWGHPRKSNILIARDGTNYANVKTNSIGAFTWLYTGGFGTRTFTMSSFNDFEGATERGASIWNTGTALMNVCCVIAIIGTLLGAIKGKIEMTTAVNVTIGLLVVMLIIYLGSGIGSILDDAFH